MFFVLLNFGYFYIFFFFQAEDGIRDDLVTGVQTCALPSRFGEIRPIDIEVGWLPRVHGSALFTRGETQAIVTTTLGTKMDEQYMDDIEKGEVRRRFMLHYNFPPYSVSETGRFGSTY